MSWVRIAVDPVSDPNGNGAAATVIPMPSTFERLVGRLRGLVRASPSTTRTRSSAPSAPAASGCDRDTVRHRDGPTPVTRRPCRTRRMRRSRTASPTPARSSGPGCRSRRTTPSARTARCCSSAATATGSLGADADEQGPRPRRAPAARRRAASGSTSAPAAWDRSGRPSEVRVNRLIRVDPDAIRREGAVLARERFEEVATAIRQRALAAGRGAPRGIREGPSPRESVTGPVVCGLSGPQRAAAFLAMRRLLVGGLVLVDDALGDGLVELGRRRLQGILRARPCRRSPRPRGTCGSRCEARS